MRLTIFRADHAKDDPEPWRHMARRIIAALKRRRYSLHNGVLVFSIVACCALFATYGFQTSHGRSVELRQATREAMNLARSLSQQGAATFQTADAVLLEMRESVEASGLTSVQLRRLLKRLEVARVDGYPMIYALTLLDEKGRVAASTQTASRSTTFRDREYFRFHQTNATREIHVGPPVLSKIDGSWIVTATRRIDRRDGSFAGLVEVKISLAFFQHIFDEVDVGKRGLITFARDDGIVLVRRPAVEALLGRSIAQGAYYKTFKRSLSGTLTVRSIFDGVKRIGAFRRVTGYPLIMIVALPETEVLADWQNVAILNFFLITCVAAMVAFAGNYLSTQIRQRKSAQDKLSELASVDGLTGLANRREFDSALERAWRRALRTRTALALLMIDADNFKSYNDRFGHLKGDEALVMIARKITLCLHRPDDLGARYGGEEFAVVLPSTDVRRARIIAERIRTSIEGTRLNAGSTAEAEITISVGLASMCPSAIGSRSDLLQAADSALYAAKRGGRNRVEASAPVGERSLSAAPANGLVGIESANRCVKIVAAENTSDDVVSVGERGAT